MAQTAQMMKPTESVLDWNSTFQGAQTSQVQSSVFMKKLLAVAVSEIMYLRAIFPERAFGNRKLEDLDLKILSEGSKIEGACQVIKWMRGCFEALDKKYLRQIQLAIYLNEDEPDNAVESYIFRFVYRDDETSVTCNDREVASSASASDSAVGIRKATLTLLRTTILLTQHLDPLPDCAFLGMKLLYYDEVTPVNYEPEGFMSCDVSSYSFDKEPLNVKVGEVNTKFHVMKLRVKTDKSQFDYDDQERFEPPVHSLPVINTPSFPIVNELPKSSSERPTENGVVGIQENPKSSPAKMESIPSTSTAVASASSDAASDTSDISFHSMGGQVRCPCDDLEDDGLMVQCMACGYWQHGFCFAVKEDADAPEKHFCHICADVSNPKRAPTDFHLHSLSPTEQKNLCIWRRTLLTCMELRTITTAQLCNKMSVTTEQSKALLKRLELEGFIIQGDGRLRNKKMVKKDVLKSRAVPQYLNRQKGPSLNFKNVSYDDRSHRAERRDKNPSNFGDSEMTSLVKTTENLTVAPKKSVLRNTRNSSKRKQFTNMDVSFNDSQEVELRSNHSSTSSKKMKSSSSLCGVKV